MLDYCNEFLWGDKWSVENNIAWFVSGSNNILFCVNMITNQYRIVEPLPGKFQGGFRLNSNCIKSDNVIFCMPDIGSCIWYYDLFTNKFQKIEMKNPNNLRMSVVDFWKCGDILWAVSSGLKQIIEINLSKKFVVRYYNITNSNEEIIARSIKSGNCIYVASALKGRIYEFNIETKNIMINDLPTIEGGLHTISVCKGKFWLSGYDKNIYIWEKDKNIVEISNHFPSNFGIYNFDRKASKFLNCDVVKYHTPTFLESIHVGDYMWFIPFQTNHILYVNTDTYKINVFEIKEEEEIENGRRREMNCKYVLQYIYKNRYIGLYSLKNEIVLEIDSKTFEIKKRRISLEEDSLKKIFPEWIFRENINAECSLYKKLLKKDIKYESRKETKGIKIYNYVCL